MIGRIDAAHVAPREKAALIYAQARSELSDQLWKASLSDDQGKAVRPAPGSGGGDVGLDTLIALLGHDGMPAPVAVPQVHPAIPLPRGHHADPDGQSPFDRPHPDEEDRSAGGLGANSGYASTLSAAAERTGLPAPALAAIVHAEAATGPDGRWLTYSRNPRSSAAGLGQFLSHSWISETERAGTWLHDIASSHNWLNDHGRVRGEARSALLALRYDGDTAIQAIADYAQSNLNQIGAAGIAIDGSVEGIARTAYVGHHLGVGDAIRFLTNGLDSGHARRLLETQIGATAAGQRIAEAGGATQAHREWLLGYITRNVRPMRFAASFAPTHTAALRA